MLSTFSARDSGVLRRLRAVIVWGVLFPLAPTPSGATDVCGLTGTTLQDELKGGAAQIAAAYARMDPSDLLSLNGGACNWTCGSGRVVTPMIKAFAFLQYNCSSTTAPPSIRGRTGPGTASQMGLSITDDEYRKEADKIFRSASSGVGDLMRVPPSLELNSQSGDVKTLTDAVEAIPGATWMKFSSTSVSNDRDGAARVIIRVPDTKKPPRFEQWIQIAINEGTGKLGRNVDFLGVQLLPDTPSSPLEDDRPVVAFRGYSRTPTGFVPEGGSSSELSKCYSCHPSGLRAVIPARVGARAAGGGVAIKPEGTIPLTGPENITAITTEVKDTKKPSVFGPTGYTALENGPPLGPSSRTNREQFVAQGCAKRLPDPRQKAIVANMNCEQCHDGETDRGILNAGTSLKTLYHKVVQNTQAPMPPPEIWDTEPSLKLISSTEREVLFECLQAEYAEILQKGLTSDLLIVP